MTESQDVTLGELARRVDRLDSAMVAGFATMQAELRGLAFVPAAVYSADRVTDDLRVSRLESDLLAERVGREEAERIAAQRAWQARLSMVMAFVGLPLSVIGSIVVALVVSQLGAGK